ncbi:hypothetical protein ACK3TF_002208 [Chlorella vulgaris]
MTLAGRMRFLYACNILLPAGLAVLHLANPRMAADHIWGGGGMSFQGSPAALALPMLGACPIMLLQIAYKLAFLTTAIAPLAVANRWNALPGVPTAVYSAYLPLLFVCAPWGYLLGSEGPDAVNRMKAE